MGQSDIAYFDDHARFFSDRTAPELVHRLKLAGMATDPVGKGQLLSDIVDEYPEALDAHIALYKFLFRTGRYQEAEHAIWATLKEAARQGGFRWNYRMLNADSADWLGDVSVARLYLFSLKALGVVRLRQGKIVLAKRVLSKLLQLDPHDEVGGGNFLEIAQSFE